MLIGKFDLFEFKANNKLYFYIGYNIKLSKVKKNVKKIIMVKIRKSCSNLQTKRFFTFHLKISLLFQKTIIFFHSFNLLTVIAEKVHFKKISYISLCIV